MTRYTPIPSSIIHDKKLNERQFHSYCLIMEKCWNPESGNFDWTEPVSMSMLAKELDKPRTTLIEHIERLMDENLIEIHRFSEIAFALIPTATVGKPTGVSISRPITIKTLSIKKEDSLIDSKKENVGQPTGVGKPTVDAEIVEFLRTKRVGDPIRSRIASGGKSLSYIKKWFIYFELKSQPVGHAIASIRDELPEPDYCDLCGGTDGKHRLVQSELSGQIFCPNENYKWGDAELLAEYGKIEPLRI